MAVMNSLVALMGLCGLGVSIGLMMLIRAWRGTTGPHRQPRSRMRRRAVRTVAHPGRWRVAAGAVGLLAGIGTGWVAGGVLAGLAAWSLPRLLAATAADRHQIARIEGIAGWSEMLRDTLAAAAGLEQTIMATAHTAPKAIRPHIQALAAELARGERLTAGLRRLQEKLADPTADLVIAALLLASQHQARQLAPLLGELAATARAQVQMRQRVEASRARMHTTVRVVISTTCLFAGGLIVLNRGFLTPYDSPSGQLVLLAIGAVFVAGFAWLRRMATIEEPERFLTDHDATALAPAVAAEREVGRGVMR